MTFPSTALFILACTILGFPSTTTAAHSPRGGSNGLLYIPTTHRQGIQSHRVVLEYSGKPYRFRSTFSNVENNSPWVVYHNISVRAGWNTVISDARIEDVADRKDKSVTVTSELTFNLLPGNATVLIAIRNTTSAPWMVYEHSIQVIGVALFRHKSVAESPQIFSGNGAPAILLKALEDGTEDIGATVSASVYGGMNMGEPELRPSSIRLIVGGDNWDASGILPWDATSCNISATRESLNQHCGMAFAPDFKSLSIRVVGRKGLESTITVGIEWVGIKDYTKRWMTSVMGIETVPSQSLTSDRISMLRVHKSLFVTRTEEKKGPWIVGVIVVFTILLIIIAFTTIWCVLNRRTPHTRTTGSMFSTNRREHAIGSSNEEEGSGPVSGSGIPNSSTVFGRWRRHVGLRSTSAGPAFGGNRPQDTPMDTQSAPVNSGAIDTGNRITGQPTSGE